MPDLERLLSAIDAAEENSYGADSDGDLSSERAAQIDYYLGRNVEPAPDGRSQVVDRTVYETLQWIMPSLSRIFANGDDVVELPPIGPDDEQGAKQEAQYLNHIILQKNNWFQVFDTAAKDALLTKSGYLYAYREKVRQVEMEKYERQTKEGVALIVKDGGEIVDLDEYPDPDYEPQPQVDPQTGQPAVDQMTGQPLPPPPPPMLYDLEVRRTREEVKYCLEALPPERCKISEQTKTVQLTQCPYFEYYDYCTISELRQYGYEVEDDIASGEYPDTEEDTARDQYSETDEEGNPIDPAMRRVKCRWIWIRYDYDEDGISELQYCVVVAKKVLHREEVNEIPVAVLCADPLPHRHIGLCPADVTVDIQRIKTSILRQGLDNLQLSNNPRTYINPSVINLDDMLVSRPGGIVRGKGVYGQDIMPMVVPFVFPQAMEALGFMEQVTEGRTGVNRYFQGTDQNALNKTSSGIQQLTTMAAQRVEQIARHFSNGVERLFSVLHALVLKGGHHADVVKLSGKWVQVDPSTWRRRTDFRISVGYGAGNKDSMVNRLMLIAQMQEKAMAGGLPIVNPRNIYETAIELTKASDFAAPERFWTDPSTAPPPEPPKPDPTMVAIEQIKAQSAQQVKHTDVQQKEMDSQRDVQIEKYKADLAAQTSLTIEQLRQQHTAQIENFRAQHQAGIEHLKGQHTFGLKDRELQAKQAEKQQEVSKSDETKKLAANLESALTSLQSAIHMVATAKKRVRRGKDGKAEGVDMLGPDGSVISSQKAVRGSDGRIEGLA